MTETGEFLDRTDRDGKNVFSEGAELCLGPAFFQGLINLHVDTYHLTQIPPPYTSLRCLSKLLLPFQLVIAFPLRTAIWRPVLLKLSVR